MRTITIGHNDSGQRLDKFICKLLPAMPKGMLYKLIRKKDIRRNGSRCSGTDILAEGDVLTMYIKDEFWKRPASSQSFQHAKGRVQVMYEDPDILVVYKPKGMYAHSSLGSKDITLLDEVQQYLYKKGEFIPEEEQSFAPALCNRIDRNTEGLVIAAKNAAALRNMNKAIRERQIDKVYLTIVSGVLPSTSAVCRAWLKKDHRNNKVTVSGKAEGEGWQEICTKYKVLANKNGMQLVGVELLTGRSHQIRAHLSYLHAPVLGDPKYGGRSDMEENQCLCAYAIRFPDREILVTAPLPGFVKRYFPDVKEKEIQESLL